MAFLLLAVACSTIIAVIFKITEGRFDRIALLTVNYLVAALAAWARLGSEGVWLGDSSTGLIVLGVLVGALFILGFALFSGAIGLAGISIATATMRLSVALPFLASWLIWREAPSVTQWIGVILALMAFVLISARRGPTRSVAHGDGAIREAVSPLVIVMVLAALFVVGGIVDTSMKVFEELYAATSSRQAFMAVVFSVALALGLGDVLRRRNAVRSSFQASILAWGVLLGLVNYGSVEFFLLALGELPGTVAFPANNVAIVGCTTVLGVAVWREKLSVINLLGLGFAIVALVLLTS